MRWRTYSHVVQQIEEGRERLDVAFTVGAQCILARLERSNQGLRRQR
jgi:hypothetical protein